MATQTLIQLKYSSANSTPGSLSISEPAYSFVSEKLFIGTDSSTVVAIGGQYYTRLLEANTPYAIPNTLVVRGGDGNTNFDDLHANTIYANTTIFAGHIYGTLTGATNPVIGASGNANNFVQSYIRNINGGSEASADFIAYSDIGSDVSGWVDMGITSSNFNSDNFAITGPEEGYIFMSGTNGSGTSGNLVIATDSTGTYNDIVFHTGSFTDVNSRIAHFRNGQGLVIDATTPSSSNISGALVVKGGVGVSDGLYADALYDFNSRVVSTITPVSGGGATLTQSKSGNTVTLTVNNTGVHSLTANSTEVTANATTGNIVFGLATTAVASGTYGGTTQIPTFTVDTKGRLTFAGNNTISTSFNLYGDSGVTVVSGGDSLTIQGNNNGILTNAGSGPNLDIWVDDTVLRSNTAAVGPQTIQTDVTVTGNLIVRGTQIISNTTIIESEDSLIKLAANNTTDALDIGFYGRYNSTGTKYAGLIRKAADKFYLLKDITSDPTSNTVSFTTANRATIDTNLVGGSVSGLSAAIAIADGGTNGTSFTTGQITYFDGTSIVSLANTGTAGSYGATSRTLAITTDALGRVSSVSNTEIAIDTSQVISGLLPVARGGSNNATFTSGSLLQFDGTKFISQANTGTAGTYGAASRTLSITTDDYGRVSSVSNNAIAIDASQIATGTLGVVNGGSGSSSFNTNGVVISAGTSTGALTAVTGSAYQVLQLNASGIPVFNGLNGGTF